MQQGIKCSKCGMDNPFGSKFCSHCGTKLLYQCPRCNGLLEPGLKFCPACGMALDWGGTLRQEPRPPIIKEVTKPEMPVMRDTIEAEMPANVESKALQIPVAPLLQQSKISAGEKVKPRSNANVWLIALIVIVLLIAALFFIDVVTRGTQSTGL